MNKILLTILAILFMTTNAHALIVIYDSETKEVLTAGSFDDTLVPDGYEKAELKGEMKDWSFPAHPTDCFFKDGRFVVNGKKLSDMAIEEEKRNATKKQEEMIKEKTRKITIDQLRKEGYAIIDE